MKMTSLFNTRRQQLFSLKQLREKSVIETVTCKGCKKEYEKSMVKSNLYICPECGYHISVPAMERINQLADEGSFNPHKAWLSSGNPLGFPGYKTKLRTMQEATGNKDAIVTGSATISGHKVMIAVLDSEFMMGSMGTVVGERFVLAIEHAMKKEMPFIAVCASGGARMQEGMFSLMQMAKTSAAVEKFTEQGGLYISVLTHPTMGGVSASFAMLGDIIIAEPDALIGFAGQRVIEQTIKEKLPKGFQKSAFMQEHGFVDMIVNRKELKKKLAQILKIHDKARIHDFE